MKKIAVNLSVFLFGLLPSFFRIFVWDCVKSYSQLPFVLIRYSIIKNEMLSCGENVYIGCNVTIKNIKKVSIGSNVSIHDNCYLDGFGGIDIGSNVSIAHATSVMSSNHTWGDCDVPIKYNPVTPGRVLIRDDVWIGCGVRVLSGAVINSRVVVAAGAVVAGSILENGNVYAGVPAKLIKSI